MSDMRWAASSVATAQVMDAFQAGLPVRLIATPRRMLETCRCDELLAEVVARNNDGFDYFPVTDAGPDGRERITGLVALMPYRDGMAADGLVRDQMRLLSEDNLIGADAGILAFVRTADRHSCRLVMSGAEIAGTVTLSDLQRMPVRAALFALVTHLGMTMAGAIRREFNGSDEWKVRLPETRRQGVEKERRMAAAADNLVEDLLFTQFCDKVTIIKESRLFADGKTSSVSKVRIILDGVVEHRCRSKTGSPRRAAR